MHNYEFYDLRWKMYIFIQTIYHPIRCIQLLDFFYIIPILFLVWITLLVRLTVSIVFFVGNFSLNKNFQQSLNLLKRCLPNISLKRQHKLIILFLIFRPKSSTFSSSLRILESRYWHKESYIPNKLTKS